MSECGGKTMKEVLQNCMTMSVKPAELPIGQISSALHSGLSLHMVLDFIGWMLLVDPSDDDKFDVIHADPHPGNFIYDLEAVLKSKKTSVEMSDSDSMENIAALLKQNGDNAFQFLNQVKLQVGRNILHVIDWGSAITNDSIRNGNCGTILSLKDLRRSVRKIIRGLGDGAAGDSSFKEGLQDLGVKEEFADFVRCLLCGAEETADYARRIGASSQDEVKEKMKEIANQLEDSDVSAELAKLTFILLIAGGMWNKFTEGLGDLVPDNMRTLASFWAHWLP